MFRPPNPMWHLTAQAPVSVGQPPSAYAVPGSAHAMRNAAPAVPLNCGAGHAEWCKECKDIGGEITLGGDCRFADGTIIAKPKKPGARPGRPGIAVRKKCPKGKIWSKEKKKCVYPPITLDPGKGCPLPPCPPEYPGPKRPRRRGSFLRDLFSGRARRGKRIRNATLLLPSFQISQPSRVARSRNPVSVGQSRGSTLAAIFTGSARRPVSVGHGSCCSSCADGGPCGGAKSNPEPAWKKAGACCKSCHEGGECQGGCGDNCTCGKEGSHNRVSGRRPTSNPGGEFTVHFPTKRFASGQARPSRGRRRGSR